MALTSTPSWAENVEDVRRRYRHLAAVYPIFEAVFWLPIGIRGRAAARLALSPGGRVLEVGCGTGRNLPHLVRAVGPNGRVYAADVTPEMLAVARKMCGRQGWTNVLLLEGDAEQLRLPEPVDAVLFSLSYGVIPRHREVLEHVWNSLRPGGRLVILDATLPSGILGELMRPLVVPLSRHTVLGNPDKAPWEDLGRLTGEVHREVLWPGAYYVCWGVRPPDTDAA